MSKISAPPLLRELVLHYLYSFFVFCGVAFVTVSLPLILREAGYSPKDIGILLGVYNLVGLLCILLFGRLLDARHCYRLLVVVSILLVTFALSRLLFWQHFLGSMFAIILLAIGFLPQASVTDSYISARYQHQVQYYGRIRSIGSIGYIALLGLASLFHLFGDFNPENLQVWAFTLYGLVGVMFLGSSHYSMPVICAPEDAITSSAPGLALEQEQATGIKLLGWPLLSVLLLVIVCWALVMGINSNFLALYLREELQQQNVGLFFMVATSSEIPIIFWGGRILYRKPLGLMLLLGFAAAVLRLSIYAFLPHAFFVLLGQLLHSMAYGLFHITVIAIVNRYFTKYRSMAIAIYASIPPLSNSFGALVGGILIQNLGFHGFFLFFLLLVLPVLLPVYLLRRRFLYL